MFMGLNGRSFSSKNWDRVRKSPKVAVDSFETIGWTVHVTLCVIVCNLRDSLGSSKMDCRIVY